MCQSPPAVGTSNQKLGGLTQHKCITLRVLGSQWAKIKVVAELCSLWRHQGRIRPLVFASSWRRPALLHGRPPSSIFKASNGLSSPLHADPSGYIGPIRIMQDNFPISQSSDLQRQLSCHVTAHTHGLQGPRQGYLGCVCMGLGFGVVMIMPTTGSSQRLVSRGQGCH